MRLVLLLFVALALNCHGAIFDPYKKHILTTNMIVLGTNLTLNAGVLESSGGGGSALWNSAGGVLSPSPAVDVVSVASQFRVGVTNSVFWGGDAAFASIGIGTFDLSAFAAGNANIFGFGDSVFDSATFTNSYQIYGLGDFTGSGASFDSSGEIYTFGNDEIDGTTFQRAENIFTLGKSQLKNGVITNSHDIAFIGNNGANIVVQDSTFLYALGKGNLSNGQFTNGTSQVAAVGTGILGLSVLDGVSDVFGLGTSTLEGVNAFSSSAIYGIGNSALQSAIIQNSSDFYAYGDSVMNSMIASNTVLVHGLGDSVLLNARLTNSSGIYAFGFHTGEGLSGSYSDNMLFGHQTLPSQSHQMVWNVDAIGSGNIYQWQNGRTNTVGQDYLGRLSLQGQTNLIGDSGTALTYNGVAIGGGDGTNDVFLATKAFRSYQGQLTHAGTVTLDFDGTTTVNALTITGNVTFATSNLATNRTCRVKITGTSTNATATFPAWKFVGGAPTTITAGKVSMLSLEAWGATDATVVAAFAEEQ